MSMIRKIIARVVIVIAFSGASWTAHAETITEFTKGMTAREGFFTFFVDENQSRIYLQVDRLDDPFIYQVGLPQGLGSNDIGLDRGQIGATRLVKFTRSGNRILLQEINTRYRALSDNLEEVRAVEDAFAASVLWGFPIQATADKTFLVDITDFLLSDQHGIARTIAARGQGRFSVEPSRSALYLPRIRNFPRNSEFEATLTLTGDNPGPYVQDVAPHSHFLTLRQHISFVALPEPGYEPRVFDPRSGAIYLEYKDYAAPLGEDMTRRLIIRHRLKKKHPERAVSDPVEPIVYYLDPGTPEPIRSALIEGGNWWAEAFEAAGFSNAFRVEMLPEGADPMDVRYNVINWVHRATRGWSYGASVVDPRTGEIIKGHVTLGSLRVRQDLLIATALTSPYATKDSTIETQKDMALARIRQLSAHEIGHTLGFAHNFAASPTDRASVMDYPHPWVTLKEDGTVDLSDAYDTGIGEWDKLAVEYAYREFSDKTAEKAGLAAILEKQKAEGLRFISDEAARGIGNLHATAHLWDNGSDMVAELARIYQLRRVALDNFSAAAIPFGAPLSSLEEVLVPLYYLPRYQMEAVGKLIGGLQYDYALRMEEVTNAYDPVPSEQQVAALDQLLAGLAPENLILPERVMRLLPPKAYGYNLSRESFPRRTGRSFDPLTSAEALAGHVFDILLEESRLARLEEHNLRGLVALSLGTYFERLARTTYMAARQDGFAGAVQRRGNHVLFHRMMTGAGSTTASDSVRAGLRQHLMILKNWLEKQAKTVRESGWRAHYRFEASRIEAFLEGRFDPAEEKIAAMPPGSPI